MALNKITHINFLKKFKNEVLLKGKRPTVEPSSDQDLSESQGGSQVETIISETVEIDIIQNIIQAPMVDAPAVAAPQEETVYDRESFLKNKKLLEKIVYEALVLRKEGRLDDYEKKLIEGLALDPDDKDLNRFLADYYFSTGNHKKALSLLKKIVELDPKDHKAIRQIGEIYLTS